jgi:hypothetical protein
MKKIIILFVLMVFCAVFCFVDAEELVVYKFLYDASPTHSAQLDILQSMERERIIGAGTFYAEALHRLIMDFRNIKNVTEKNAADEQAILLSALLGAEKHSQAASDLWLLVEEFSAPLVKAEALMALGKIRAAGYLPQVIRVLESTNNAPTTDRLNGERIAFGAIIALEKYQDISGYLPVFFASTGWYSDRIKNQATRTLTVIADDPVPFMMEIIKGPGHNYPTKYAALRTIESSKVDNRKKVEVAVLALDEGWKGSTSDTQLRIILADMRKMSIRMINRYKTDDASIYPLLERCYTSGIDSQEKLDALSALASQGTDEAAQRLSKFLMDLNAKRQSNNIRPEDEQMVRAVIPALGQTGRAAGRAALSAVMASNWTPAVKALAENAIKQLGRQ